MTAAKPPIAILAAEAPPRTLPSNYPEPFRSLVKGRTKRVLGDTFGLKNFGANLTRMEPGSRSSVRHAHTKQDELVYILEGRPTLVTDEGRTLLGPGMVAGFAAGTGNAHHLVNESDGDVLFLEIGDRTPDDTATYPDEDLQATKVEGGWKFTRKDGTEY